MIYSWYYYHGCAPFFGQQELYLLSGKQLHDAWLIIWHECELIRGNLRKKQEEEEKKKGKKKKKKGEEEGQNVSLRKNMMKNPSSRKDKGYKDKLYIASNKLLWHFVHCVIESE